MMWQVEALSVSKAAFERLLEWRGERESLERRLDRSERMTGGHA